MTEKKLRELFGLMSDDNVLGGYYKLVPEALADEPDVVKVDKVLRGHKLEPPKSRMEKFYLQGWADAINAVADNLERKFGFRLTETGWEWTE